VINRFTALIFSDPRWWIFMPT